MASDQRRYGLRELALGTFDIISTGLADARMSAATAGKSTGGQRSRQTFRQWASTSASLLEQLLEITAHPASAIDGQAFLHILNLTPVVNRVGDSLLAIKDVQQTSQRLASASQIVSPPPAGPPAILNILGAQHLASLQRMGVPSFLSDDALVLQLTGPVGVRCRLEPVEQRLIIEPVLLEQDQQPGAGDGVGAGAEGVEDDEQQSKTGAADAVGGVDTRSLRAVLRYWVSRLHEVVPEPVVQPAELGHGSGNGGVTMTMATTLGEAQAVEARAKQLAAIHAVLDSCTSSMLLQHVGGTASRLSRSLPASPASAVGGGGRGIQEHNWIMRRQAGKTALAVHASPFTLLCDAPVLDLSGRYAQTGHAGSAAVTVAALLHTALMGALATGGQGGASLAISAGVYAYRVGTGDGPLLLGRDSAQSAPDLARVLHACGHASAADALLAAIPTLGTTANAEADAKAYDASTLRSVSSGPAVRPLPGTLRRLLSWLTDKPEHSAPSAASGADNEGTAAGSAGAASSATALSFVVHSSSAGAAQAALLALSEAQYLSPDYACVDVRVQVGRDAQGNKCRLLMVRPVCALHKAKVEMALSDALTGMLAAVRTCRKAAHAEIYRLAAAVAVARTRCALALQAAGGELTVDEEEGCLHVAVGGMEGAPTLRVSIDGDGALRVTVVGSLPSVHESHMPTTVTAGMQAVAEAATVRLARRRDAVARVLCKRRINQERSSGPAPSPTASSARDAGILPGFLQETHVTSLLYFGEGLGSTTGLANTAAAQGVATLRSMLLVGASVQDDAASGNLPDVGPGASSAARVGGGTGSGSGQTAGHEGGKLSLLGAPLEEGTDCMLASALSFRARHDAELLALLSCSSDVPLDHVLGVARQLGTAFVSPKQGIDALRAALSGQTASSGGSSPVAVPSIPASSLDMFLRTSCDCVSSSPSQLYTAMKTLTSGKTGNAASMNELERMVATPQAVSRKLAAVHAVALAEVAADAVTVLNRLLPLQRAASDAAQLTGGSTGYVGGHAGTPMFISRHAADKQAPLQPWVAVPLTSSAIPIVPWLRLGLGAGVGVGGQSGGSGGGVAAGENNGLTGDVALCARMLQYGTCAVDSSSTGSSSAPAAPPAAGTLSYGITSLTLTSGPDDVGVGGYMESGPGQVKDEKEQVVLSGAALWAPSAFVAQVTAGGGPAASHLRAPKMGAHAQVGAAHPSADPSMAVTQGSVLLVVCPPEALAGLCQPVHELQRLLSGPSSASASAWGSSAMAHTHALVRALSTAGAAAGAVCVVLLPPQMAAGAGQGAAMTDPQVHPEEGFCPTVSACASSRTTVPVLWAYGLGASLLRRAGTVEAGPAQAPMFGAPVTGKAQVGSKASMFRSGAQPLRMGIPGAFGTAPGSRAPTATATATASGGAPSGVHGQAGAKVTIRLPGPAVCAGLQVCIASRPVHAPSSRLAWASGTGAAGGGAAGAKRRRVEGPDSSVTTNQAGAGAGAGSRAGGHDEADVLMGLEAAFAVSTHAADVIASCFTSA